MHRWVLACVFLTVLASCDSITGVIPPLNSKPTASFTVKLPDPNARPPGEWTVRFDASASSDDSRIQEFIWDFGDGTSSQTFKGDEGRLRDHTYFVESGTFVAGLRVRDDDQVLSDPYTFKFVLMENRLPTARFTVVPASGPPPLIVTLDASESSDPDENDADALRFSWNFGDGEAALFRSPVVQHIYKNRGRYTVSLTVNDGKEGSSPAFRIVDVQ